MRSERSDKRPAWWLLYAIGLLLTSLIGLVETSVSAGGPRTILELVLVFMMVGLMMAWVRHNRAAMELENVRDDEILMMPLDATLTLPYLEALGRHCWRPSGGRRRHERPGAVLTFGRSAAGSPQVDQP